jgi:hypothetical protein
MTEDFKALLLSVTSLVQSNDTANVVGGEPHPVSGKLAMRNAR